MAMLCIYVRFRGCISQFSGAQSATNPVQRSIQGEGEEVFRSQTSNAKDQKDPLENCSKSFQGNLRVLGSDHPMTWFVRSEKRHMDMVRFHPLSWASWVAFHSMAYKWGPILQVSTPPNATLHPGERAGLIKA